ncbi:hypothetical protein [Evansella cellulosilytica]|uniref:Uncharacterized protein n=1 Tax=Evansella cellulosilytica (strain ATCC 21833 / DSM 2522 / FERM P-1141 / JCM 9156 / N-4) TaxID=649639 RepID=E6TXN6_EVAC2|nr:hypothetical protein [Evansella cellulosilytica]ADU29962.1 hypothetical protein Bcell_1699 [Evansella cellulosilytica DSM 2522]
MKTSTYAFSDDLHVNAYFFSEFIVCIDVTKSGQHVGSFCSDAKEFEDLDEEEFKSIIQQHVNGFDNSVSHRDYEKRELKHFDLYYYPFSDFMYCMDVYRLGEKVSSLCVDRDSFEEWMEDENHLLNVVEKLAFNG